jgi:hypothetical protein
MVQGGAVVSAARTQVIPAMNGPEWAWYGRSDRASLGGPWHILKTVYLADGLADSFCGARVIKVARRIGPRARICSACLGVVKP